MEAQTGANIPGLMPLPEPVLRRLPWYLAYIATLRTQRVQYVSTTRIASALELAPSLIAKDLSVLGIKGKTRIGYQVDTLEETLREYLGFSKRHNAAMCGAGSLGSALLADNGLLRYGLDVVAAFDVSKDVVGRTVGTVKVSHISELPKEVKRKEISIGILAVPVEEAQKVADILVNAGVRAIWNFTPTRIRVPEHAVVSNTSIYSHLAVMYNRLSILENQ